VLRNLLIFIAVCFASFNAQAVEVIFEGIPRVKMEIREGFTSSLALSLEQILESSVRISGDGENYFWVSRGDVPLIKTESEGFVTYVAVTGAGYIRVMSRTMREAYERLPVVERAKLGYRYMGHLTHRMGAVVYFGE
jgi:hypothetical protein